MSRQAELANVNWLSIEEIAELWAPQLRLPKSTILRELQIAFYKLEIDYPYNEPIDVDPNTVDLPSPETLINREFIERFHDKQMWKLPQFWFSELPTGPSFPGRPSVMHAILQELDRLAQNGELSETLAQQSRILEAWAIENMNNVQTPKAASIANGIRTAYNTLKKHLS